MKRVRESFVNLRTPSKPQKRIQSSPEKQMLSNNKPTCLCDSNNLERKIVACSAHFPTRNHENIHWSVVSIFQRELKNELGDLNTAPVERFFSSHFRFIGDRQPLKSSRRFAIRLRRFFSSFILGFGIVRPA